MTETYFGAPDIPLGVGPVVPMDDSWVDVDNLRSGFAAGWLNGPDAPVADERQRGWQAAFVQGQAARGLYDYQQASQQEGGG